MGFFKRFAINLIDAFLEDDVEDNSPAIGDFESAYKETVGNGTGGGFLRESNLSLSTGFRDVDHSKQQMDYVAHHSAHTR